MTQGRRVYLKEFFTLRLRSPKGMTRGVRRLHRGHAALQSLSE
jgi:hypothetical protein